MAVSGLGVAYVTSGFLLVWSGFRNVGIKDELTGFLSGNVPSGTATGTPVIGVSNSGGTTSTSSQPASTASQVTGSSKNGQQALKKAAAKYGWDTGAEWNALNYVEMREAGYNLTATNPTSKAYGMAQFDVPPGGNLAANKAKYYQYGGNPDTYDGQAVAMVNYIKQTYGDPIKAAAHERTYNWY